MSFTVTIDTIFCLLVVMGNTVTIGTIMVSMVNVVVVAMQPGLMCCVVDKVM